MQTPPLTQSIRLGRAYNPFARLINLRECMAEDNNVIELDNFELSLERVADNVLAASKGKIKEVAIVVTEEIDGEDKVRAYTHLEASELADLLLDALHIPEVRNEVLIAEETTLEFTLDDV